MIKTVRVKLHGYTMHQ